MKLEFIGNVTTDVAGVLKDFLGRKTPSTAAGARLAQNYGHLKDTNKDFMWTQVKNELKSMIEDTQEAVL